jgi:hypothetical protein
VTRPRLILVFLLVLLGLGLWNSRQPIRTGNSQPRGDILLFEAVVERVRAGEPYYVAMRAELVARGYPTASVLNWRPPATFLLLARAPAVAHTVIIGLSLLALVLTVLMFRNAPPFLTVAAAVMQIGAVVMPSIPADGLYMPETWAGVFLVLSVLGYSLSWMRLAVCAAIAAVCARELALPYVVVAIAMAFLSRRTRELRWFAAGLTVFVAYYLGHAWVAMTHVEPGDMAHKASWIAFGGWGFVVRTVSMGGWFLVLPLWTAAIAAVVVLASLWSPADRHLKAVVGLYLAGFCVVGQPFNTYWGLMTGPTWGVAAVYGLMGLRHLVREA